jgi:hypothetical protein
LSISRVAKKMKSYYNEFMKKLPIGVRTFFEIINENYLYIDKINGLFDWKERIISFFFLNPLDNKFEEC